MNSLFYSLRSILIFLLVVFFGNAVMAQLQVTKSMNNVTTGGDGTVAYTGDMLEYSIAAKNVSSANVINATLYDNIPAGSSYVTGSTKLNGVSVADVSGNMPFIGNGGLINSPGYTSGVLAPNATATVVFRVRVNANVGAFSASATLRAGNSAGIIATSSNSVTTAVVTNSLCSPVYETTGYSPTSNTFNVFNTVSTGDGTTDATAPLYDGSTGFCYDAVTHAPLSIGSIVTSVAAIAYDKNANRIYFVNNTSNKEPLCYVDLNSATIAAYRYTGYPLETSTTGTSNVNRMTFASDGYGYALTSGGSDLIRFYVDPATNLPVITRLGALVNSVTNGAYNVRAEPGGDIFGDGSGKLYLIANSSRMYSIDPATRIATFVGSISPFPGTSSSIAASGDGYLYMGGAYQYVYRVNPANLSITAVNNSTANVYYNGDYASCSLPVLASLLKATKSYRNLSVDPGNLASDTVECTIEVTNTGNFNATAAMLYDTIPANGTYLNGSTTMNGVSVSDVGGAMPFSAAGGQYINSFGEIAGLVKVGDTNKAVIKYWVLVPKLQTICNQAQVTYSAANGYTVIFSDDPAQPGSSDATCFYADTTSGLQGRMATTAYNTTPFSGQPSLQVRPNPFHSELHVQVQLAAAQMVKVQIFDLYGRTVYTTSEKLTAGVNSLTLHMPSNMAGGVYMLEVLTGNNKLLQQKLLKQ